MTDRMRLALALGFTIFGLLVLTIDGFIVSFGRASAHPSLFLPGVLAVAVGWYIHSEKPGKNGVDKD